MLLTADMIKEVDWDGVTHKTEELTSDLRSELTPNKFYLAFPLKNGKLYISKIALSDFSAMRAARAKMSIYTLFGNAYEMAKTVNYGYPPEHHTAKYNGYYDHYHAYRANKKSHIFYGLPRCSY